ncbi:hypothetical protein [Saccharothrix luteola]|uniref:hypothetical protein n=1 Tax=Saccharothrix luteola TaxID=2893018 RepID=UPI001E4418A9|nr:hypothetical protein [Saccharothrix luteola]MCC8245070.1 hypothetical protein [Saccharothrix luteola]
MDRQSTGGWVFSTEIDPITGTDADWVRQEIATAVRDLLLWALADAASASGDVVEGPAA